MRKKIKGSLSDESKIEALLADPAREVDDEVCNS
jgi:hypothetical protein